METIGKHREKERKPKREKGITGREKWDKKRDIRENKKYKNENKWEIKKTMKEQREKHIVQNI